MTWRRAAMGAAAMCAAAGASACSAGDRWATLPPKSVIAGTLDAASFSPPATGISAVDENGSVSTATPDATGAFSLSLTSGHTYRIRAVLAQASALVVFPKDDRVDDAFDLESDGAVIQLGAVRMLGAPSIMETASSATCPDGLTADGGACTVEAPTAACTQGYASTPAACDDVATVLGYGAAPAAMAAAPPGTMFAYAAIEPPCDVRGCDLPDPGNPSQSPGAD